MKRERQVKCMKEKGRRIKALVRFCSPSAEESRYGMIKILERNYKVEIYREL